MPFIYNEKMDIYCSLSEYKWIYALVCWGVQSCAQYFQSIMSSEGSHWKLLHYAYIFVETDRDWYFSTSCDLFIEMKRRFSQSGPSLHIIESAPFEAYLECLRHTSSFSSSIFHLSVLLILCLQVSVIKLLSHLWSWTLFSVLLLWSACVMTQFTPSKTMTQIWSRHTCGSHKSHVSINDLSIFILGSATHQSDFSAVVMLHLRAHLNGRQKRYIVDSNNCQYNRHYHPINFCISDLYIFHLLGTMVQKFQS